MRGPAEMALTLPELPVDPRHPLTLLGYTRGGVPVWPICGAEGDDEDGDRDDDVIDAGSENGDDDADKGYKPPSEEEWRRTQAALKRANQEATRNRLKVKELSKPGAGEEDAAQKAAAEAEKRFKPVAVRAAAKAAFLEAGLNDANPDRVTKLLRLIDLDEVDVDEDGDVTGLDHQIDAIKDDYPELFQAPKERKRATRLDASGRSSGGDTKPKSTGEKIAAAILAGR